MPVAEKRSANGPSRSRRVPERPWAITTIGVAAAAELWRLCLAIRDKGAMLAGYSHAAQRSAPEAKLRSCRSMPNQRRPAPKREIGAAPGPPQAQRQFRRATPSMWGNEGTTAPGLNGKRSMRSTEKPAASIALPVSRAMWQPPAILGQKVASARR